MTDARTDTPALDAEVERQKAQQSDPKLAACAALVAALGELTNPGRDSTATIETKKGGSFSYAYAALDVVLDGVRPVLAKHGLGLVQPVKASTDGVVEVQTRILHEGGAIALEAPTIARVVEGGPQEVGSFVTYARRYQVLAVLGIHPAGEDDDAAAAQPASRARGSAPQREPAGLPDPVVGGLHMSQRTNEELQALADAPPSKRVEAMARSWLAQRVAEAEAGPPKQEVLPDAAHDDDAGGGYGS